MSIVYFCVVIVPTNRHTEMNDIVMEVKMVVIFLKFSVARTPAIKEGKTPPPFLDPP